jgi:Replication initiator protein, pSAM2
MMAVEQLAGALLERASRPDYQRFEAQLRSSGYCARPVRLVGHLEVCDGAGRRRVWSTDTEPDGILRKACGNRREAVCPQCAERYRGDAYQTAGCWAPGREGGARFGGRALGGVLHADRTELRARPYAAARIGWSGATLPAAS